MINAQVPFRCQGAELEHLSPNVEQQIRDSLASKRGAILYGPTGTGKTYAMVAAMKAVSQAMPPRKFGPNVLLDEERSTLCAFVDWPEFIATLEDEKDLRSKLLGARGPVFLDDVGQEHAPISGYLAGKAESVFDQFVNRRTGMDVPLWITTNLTPNEIAKRYGERAMSRLAEHCALIEITGKDRRIA